MSKTATFFAGVVIGIFLEQTYTLPRLEHLLHRVKEWEKEQRSSK
jgi:hypothetical protein